MAGKRLPGFHASSDNVAGNRNCASEQKKQAIAESSAVNKSKHSSYRSSVEATFILLMLHSATRRSQWSCSHRAHTHYFTGFASSQFSKAIIAAMLQELSSHLGGSRCVPICLCWRVGNVEMPKLEH
eukprot:scaffold2140_cov176-Pinguiococcus_pyrenoidosus.AAC.1